MIMPIKESGNLDYNFSLLPILFGIIILINSKKNSKNYSSTLLYILFLSTFSIRVFFSGSRRGAFIYGIIIGYLILLTIYRIAKKRKEDENLYYTDVNLKSAFILLCLPFITYLILLFTPQVIKEKSLEILGSGNKSAAMNKIATNIIRYGFMINIDNASDFYEKIWDPIIDPYNPESGWGVRTHETVFPLIGDNVEIVPIGSKGYRMDSTCNADSWNGNAYSYSLVDRIKCNVNDTINASVYCYVSKDFNGSWASIRFEEANESYVSEYDMADMGVWQKLNLSAISREGSINFYLYFAKYEVTDFSDLSGYIIYAYPHFNNKSNIVNLNNPLSLKPDKYLNSNGDYYLCRMSLNDISRINLLQDSEHLLRNSDPFRNMIANLISEDTTYNKFDNVIKVDSLPNRFLGSRIDRWRFGWLLFVKEYNIRQKICGNGFNFLNWYGFYFLKDKTASDWPHNPFLSILLYSGILGLLLYLFLLYKVFYYYIKYRKEYALFFIFFLITFFFSFFSGGSPFDPPIMGFFTLLPFFIHSIHKNDNTKQELNTINEKDTDHR